MSALWLIVLFVLLRPLAGDVSGPSFDATPRTGIAADRPDSAHAGTTGPTRCATPGRRLQLRPCPHDHRTIAVPLSWNPVGRASHPDRDP